MYGIHGRGNQHYRYSAAMEPPGGAVRKDRWRSVFRALPSGDMVCGRMRDLEKPSASLLLFEMSLLVTL